MSRICPNCKKNIEDDAGFCRYCGFRVLPGDNDDIEPNRSESVDIGEATNEHVRKKKSGKLAVIIIIVIILVAVGAFGVIFGTKEMHYQAAIKSMDAGDYESARADFANTQGYKDSTVLIEECYYREADGYYNEEEYDKVIEILKDHTDADKAKELLENAEKRKKYNDAKDKLSEAAKNSLANYSNLCKLSRDGATLTVNEGSADNATMTGLVLREIFEYLNIPTSVMNDMFNVSTALIGGSGEEESGDYIVKWRYYHTLNLEITVKDVESF